MLSRSHFKFHKRFKI